MSTELEKRATTQPSTTTIPISLTVNDAHYEVAVDPRMLLVHLLRDTLQLTGTNIGCLSGHCGACTVILDGQIVKSCTILAANADGATITTIEGLAPEGALSSVQEAFWSEYGFQCGYCTPGMVMAVTALLDENPHPTDDDIKRAISGNLCRCTGYQNIIKVVRAASGRDRIHPVQGAGLGGPP